MERRTARPFVHALRGVCASGETRAPRGAPSRRFLSPGPRFLNPAFALRPIQRAPRGAAVVPPDPGTGASRVRGYESRPQAPHLGSILETSREDALSRARQIGL